MHIFGQGLLFALAACGLWALSFVSPIVLEDFPPALVAFGRYAAFGLFSIALLPAFWRHALALRRVDWWKASVLSTFGNLVYYILLANAIQMIDVSAPTVIIGLLPLTIPVVANYRRPELPWRDLIGPLSLIAFGLAFVHAHEYQRLSSIGRDLLVYASGIGLSIAALACWTWYGISNASWLQSRPHINTGAWTIAQGTTLLPLVILGLVIVLGSDVSSTTYAQMTESRSLTRFLLVSAIVGLASSWLATLCWSHASRLLPTTVAGQLIVFEMVAAVAYGHVYQGRAPSVFISVGVALLCVGVTLGVRAVQRSRAMLPT